MASMGPRLLRRGDKHELSEVRDGGRKRFNGAAAVTPRRPEIAELVAQWLATASMGPRLLRRGDPIKDIAFVAATVGFNGAAAVTPRRLDVWAAWKEETAALQWGRGCYAAETQQWGEAAPPSVRTLQWGRGCYAAETAEPTSAARSLCDVASMGPRLLRRGDSQMTVVSDAPRAVLQWGRGCYAAETKSMK